MHWSHAEMMAMTWSWLLFYYDEIVRISRRNMASP
jgi:hypothetical protein